ncbi:type I polyketide synthase [Nocardiopsis sp. N85]|uniref:type I polyketide synthase n=1 Tax=Nocardiopsis sp. N85 TaxID=3029400 RepID=UPI00237F33AB|nr:type I polyketide synthase [Nocardiopsis sp. N85]MDE3719850.1 type I polyketide synthase [Nocardiopsis sp. N85]
MTRTTNEDKFRELVKKMAVDLRQARSRVTELEERDHEPIAIVGIGCRFPGITDPEGLWDLVIEGRETLGPFPEDRGWDLDRLLSPDPDDPGSTYVRSASFIADAGDFDPAFFGINPREALAMDPQHRLVLETAWEALEHAGIVPASLRATPAGVFVGTVGQTYGPPVQESPPELVGYRMLGAMPAVAAGRVSYTLGLEGPAVTVDTACSSSLTAVSLAVRSLRAGESSLALAGGVGVYTDVSPWVSFGGHGVLAPDGRCKAFSADADGTGWGEAAGMIVLERLSDARRNGRHVLALLRGVAVNQDGASSGLTAPSGPAQERVIRAALADARLTPADVDAVEAHGTGTRLGDPIEAGALSAVYGRDRVGDPLWLGSLKSNVGHTGAAAGVAGVIKTVQALRHGTLPPTLHVSAPTPHVEWASGGVAPILQARPWPETGRARRAGVSAFGASGTNAHVVLEQAPEAEPAPARERTALTPAGPPVPVPWVLSGHGPDALADQIRRLRDRVAADPDLDPVDVGATLATARTPFTHRAAVVGADRATLLARLDALAAGAVREPGIARGRAHEGRTVFVYPGQGSQWEGMARTLLTESPVFAARIADCERALAPHNDWRLTDVLLGRSGAPSPDRADVVPQLLWAVMIGLTALWRAHGVHPDAVVGHSQGEVAAAHIAGALTLEQSAEVIAVRSRVLGRLNGDVAMAVISQGAADLEPRLADAGDLHIAVANSPGTTVVGGDRTAVLRLIEASAARGVRARLFADSLISHTPHTAAVRDELLGGLAHLAPSEPDVPLYTPVTGGLLDRPADADHWYAGLSRPVLFQKATEALLAAGHTRFIEVSAHPVLTVPVTETIAETGANAAAIATLRRDEGGTERLRTALAEAFAHGAAPDWSTVFGDGARFVDLPTYAFQRRRLWLTADGGRSDVTSAGLEREEHPLLGAALPLADTGTVLFTGRLSRGSHPWLSDHAALDTVLLPGTAFLDLALAAGERLGVPHVAELIVQVPLVLPDRGGVQLQVVVEAADDHGHRAITVHARPAGDPGAPDLGERPWTRHACGTLALEPATRPRDLVVWPPAGAEPVDTGDLYAGLEALGYSYGPAFRGLTAAWTRGDEVWAEIDLPAARHAEAARFGLHPALADAAQHAIGCAPWMPRDGVRLPFGWSGVTLHAVGATRLRVHVRPTGTDEVTMLLADSEGAPVAEVESLVLRAPAADLVAKAPSDDLFHIEWSPAAAPVAPGRQGWAVVGEDLLDVASALTAAGHTVRAHPDVDALLTALDHGAPVPDHVLLPRLVAPVVPDPADVRAAVKDAVAAMQRLLADPRTGDARQVVLTHRAVAATADEDVPDLVHAPLWGLVRAAAQEHPGRFAIVDTDDPGRCAPVLVAALTGDGEQTAIRAGVDLSPRLVRTERIDTPLSFGDGTVLVTGATGTLGGEIARHLVDRHGVRDLLLVSRSGHDAKGAAELEADLTGRGAHVAVAACDIADRDRAAALLSGHRVTGVVHVAADLDDALFTSITPDAVDRVLRPKVDAVRHLHDLLPGASAFVLFSSAAGTLGSPGQAHYSAANAYTDMLAHHRRATGLHAVSLSWGMWARRGGGTARLDDSDIGRYARLGLAAPMTTDHGLTLFDDALNTGRPHLLPVPMDLAGARARAARTGAVSTMLSGLVRPPRRRAGTSGPTADDLRGTLARTPLDRRAEITLAHVLSATAEVLGHTGATEIGADDPFLEMGFDSLTAVELRNRLATSTGLRLPAGLAFAHPTPRALAAHLAAETIVEERPAETSRGSAASDGLVDLFVDACRRRRIADGLDLLWSASRMRPTFTGTADIGPPRVPVRLSREGEATRLICLPSILMVSGVQEFARFAGRIRGHRKVDVIAQPGFGDGEPLPEDIDAVAEVLADAVAACAGEDPYVLVSRSSGGWVAHEVLRRLEDLQRRGSARAPVITALMDTPDPADLDVSGLPTIETGVVERAEMIGIMDGVRLTAMGAYLRLFRDWRPGPVETPVLQVRPEQATVDRDGRRLAPFTWTVGHEVLRVPGDHFTMLEGHVDVVGVLFHDWLTARGL